jgi:hypothetical protein
MAIAELKDYWPEFSRHYSEKMRRKVAQLVFFSLSLSPPFIPLIFSLFLRGISSACGRLCQATRACGTRC